jgi:hypothetical protein
VAGVVESLLFLASADLIIACDRLYLEAQRWDAAGYADVARIRRRMGDRLMKRARAMCGDRGLPWGA